MKDANKQKIFTSFLICNETGRPPAFNFRQPTNKLRVPCTVDVNDSIFHLFRAYLDQDVPLICRLPSRDSETGHWAQISISLVGKAELSHFHIESKINFIIHYDRTGGWITGGTGYSIGPTVILETNEDELGWHRVKIGDRIPFEFSIRYSCHWNKLTEAGFQRSRFQISIL